MKRFYHVAGLYALFSCLGNNLKNYLPGRFRSCSACGNVIHFNDAVAEKIQVLTKELEAMIREAIEDVHKLR